MASICSLSIAAPVHIRSLGAVSGQLAEVGAQSLGHFSSPSLISHPLLVQPIASSTALDLRDPSLLAMAAAERHLLDAEYDEYAAANASGATCCRVAALILMALLLLRHALIMAVAGTDEDTSTFFTLLFLRAVGFLLPCYIMARAMNILQRRR